MTRCEEWVAGGGRQRSPPTFTTWTSDSGAAATTLQGGINTGLTRAAGELRPAETTFAGTVSLAEQTRTGAIAAADRDYVQKVARRRTATTDALKNITRNGTRIHNTTKAFGDVVEVKLPSGLKCSL